MTTDWLSAIGILLAGLVVGFMFVYAAMRRKQGAAGHDDLDRLDLEAKRDALIRQLRAGDLADDERQRIEREAAEVLRALDHAKPAPLAPQSGERVPEGRVRGQGSSALAGFLWGAGTVVVLFFIGWFVTKNATPKEAPQQNAPMQQAAAQQQPQEIQQLEAQVKNNPDDNDARILLAKAYLDRENLMGVFEQTTAVLAKNPNDPRAQTYQAIVRMSMGQPVEAKKLLESATNSDPKLVDAWVALAWLRSQQGDSEGMTQAIESAIKQHPEDEQRLRAILTQIQQRASAPSGGGQAPPPVQSSSNGPGVHVTIDLAPGARTTGILYVMARDESSPTGPPAAVKRIDATSFPITIDLTAADSMMGTPLPTKMRVEARLDGDGNVMTKDPSDPKASQDNVAIGANVTLKLQ